MKNANKPSGEDFRKTLEALFPKFIEVRGYGEHPSKAYMLHGYRLMGGGYKATYASFLAKKCENLYDEFDEDAIDCIKYLAKSMSNVVDIRECTEERYEELCRDGEPEKFDVKESIAG